MSLDARLVAFASGGWGNLWPGARSFVSELRLPVYFPSVPALPVWSCRFVTSWSGYSGFYVSALGHAWGIHPLHGVIVRGALRWLLDAASRGAHDRGAKKRRLAGPEGRSKTPAPSPRASLANALGSVNRLGVTCA